MKLVLVELLALFGALIACKFDKVPVGMYGGLDRDVPSVIGLGVVSESHIKLNVFDAEVGSTIFTGSPLIKYSFDKESCTLKVGPEEIAASRFEWISFVGDGKPKKWLAIEGEMTLDHTFTLADDGTLISYSGFALKRKDTMDWNAELGQLQHLKLTRREVETLESLMNEMTEKNHQKLTRREVETLERLMNEMTEKNHLKLTRREVETFESLMKELTEKNPLVV